MITIKIIHSVFFISLSCILFLIYDNKKHHIKSIFIYLMIIYAILLMLYNTLFNGLSNKLFLFLILYSFCYVILQIMKHFVQVFKKSKVLRETENIRNIILMIGNFILNKLIIVLMLIFELRLIWNSSIFENMLSSK